MRKPAIMSAIMRLFGMVTLVPFLLLTLIPPHVMPAHGADGTLTMVLCVNGGETVVTVDLATGKPVEHTPQSTDTHCDWANGQAVAAHLAQPVLTPEVQQPRPASAPALTTLLATARATGLPPSTGPPALI